MDFISALLSYGVVLLCFVAAGTIAVFLGITLRKRKNKTEEQAQNQNS